MPVGRITEDLPRPKTAMDLNRGRGPNAGTVWAGSEPDPNQLIDSGEAGHPGRFTQYATKDTPKADPSRRPVQEVLDQRGFDCAVCKLHFGTMDTFNAHCVPDPRGSGKEMRCEVDKRLFEEKSAAEKAHMIDPSAIAGQVADALAPALKQINDSFELVGRALLKLAGEKEPKAKKEKKRGRPRLVRGEAPAGRSKPVGEVGSGPEPVADRTPEPEAPVQPS